MATLQPHLNRANKANGINAGMKAKTAILHRHHRIDHDARDILIVNPLPINRAERQDNAAVLGADADDLSQ